MCELLSLSLVEVIWVGSEDGSYSVGPKEGFAILDKTYSTGQIATNLVVVLSDGPWLLYEHGWRYLERPLTYKGIPFTTVTGAIA